MRYFLRGCVLTAGLWFFASISLAEQPFPWEPTLESAQRQAMQTQRLILVHFWATTCIPCQRMETEVFNQASVATQVTANYVPVKINADQFPDVAHHYGIQGLPTDVILTPQGQVVQSLLGRTDAASYVARLNQVAAACRQYSILAAQTPNHGMPGDGNLPSAIAGATSSPSLAATSSSENRFLDYSRSAALNPSPPATTAATTPPPIPPPAVPSPLLAVPAPAYGQPGGMTSANGTSSAPGSPPDAAAAPATRENANLPSPNATPSPPLGNALVKPPASPDSSFNPPSNLPPLGQPAAVPPLPGNAPNGINNASLQALPARAIPPTQSTMQSPPPTARANASPSNAAAPGNPPLGLEAYCPVTLVEKQQWTRGDRRYGAIHRGQTYLFAGPEEQRRFFVDPDRFAPMISGCDVVLAVEQGKSVPGLRAHGVYYANHVFLFADEASLSRFEKNPAYYANQALEALQASRPPKLPAR